MSDVLNVADAMVIVTNHSVIDYELLERGARLIIDTRYVMSQHKDLVNKLVTA